MDLVDFVLARVEEEEASWRFLLLKDDGFATATEKGLRRCAEKRRVARAYGKKPSDHLLAQLKHYALVYYDHPDYNDQWCPVAVPRWTS